MAWERAQDKQKDHEKKERQKGSLIIPLMRSHSSLSPSVLRKKWRKRSSKTDTEEWDGGGRIFSQSLIEESDDEEMRRRSVCGIVGEQRDKRDRLADELCAHTNKAHDTHPNISVVVSSSVDSDVFEKEHTEASLNQQNDNSATCVVEETHHHEQDTNQDESRTETQGHPSEQNIEKDKSQDDTNTEPPIQVEERILEPEESTPIETSQEEDIQTVFSKQEEEMPQDSNIQEEEMKIEHCEQQEETEDRLPLVIITEDNLQNEENIPEKGVQIHVVQEEERSQTSSEEDLCIHTATEEDEETPLTGEKHDVDKEECFHQEEFNVLPEETKESKEITDPSKMCEENDDNGLEEERQDMSLEERDSNPLQISEASFLQTEQETETEYPERSVDIVQQSQTNKQEHPNMDATVSSEELVHCPMDSTVKDTVGSGNPEQSEVEAADSTNTLEPDVTVASSHSENSDMDAATVATIGNKEISENNPEKSEENKSPVNTTEESSNLTHNVEDTILIESNEMHVPLGPGNPENNTIDFTNEHGKPESSGEGMGVESCIAESNNMPVTSESGNHDGNTVDSVVGNPESNVLTTRSGNSENVTDVTTESEKIESNEMEIVVGSGNSESNVESFAKNPECNNELMTISGNPESNTVVSDVGSGNPECSDVQVTTRSGIPESTSAVGSGHADYKDVHFITESDHTETNRDHVTAGSGNPECNTEDCAAGSDNPQNTECAIPGNSQGLDSPSLIPSSKSPNPNVPPAQLRVRRTSSSRVFYPTILSEDTFREPQQQEHTHSEKTTHTQDTHVQPNSQTKSDIPKRLGLFRRLRGETNKTPVPKILIQDFSEKEEKLTAKERRRRKREKERKEREEKDRKKREKEMEKDKEKERKKPQTRGKSFQVLSKKGVDNVVPPGNSDSQTSRSRRNSAPFSDNYF